SQGQALPGGNLLSELAPEIQKLKGLAVGTLFGAIREMVLKVSPEHVGQQLREILDSMTQKLGGEVIPGSDWADCPLKTARAQRSSKGDDHEDSVETKVGGPLESTQGQDQEAVGEFQR